MTTIAYRDGIIAADRQAYLGRGKSSHTAKTKLHRCRDGRVAGVASSIVGAGVSLYAWLDDGAPIDKIPIIKNREYENEFEMMVVHENGTIWFYSDNFFPTMIEADFFAIGSGAPYALGAMMAGVTAPGAVTIAGAFDAFTGKGIDIWAVKQPEPIGSSS